MSYSCIHVCTHTYRREFRQTEARFAREQRRREFRESVAAQKQKEEKFAENVHVYIYSYVIYIYRCLYIFNYCNIN